MAGVKLIELKQEILKYVGLPYFINTGRHKNNGDNVMVGKGTAKEIALKTIEFANDENIKLLDLSAEDIYNYQKKHHLGIDCSGLACNLLNFYFNIDLNPRRTSANMLTSEPLSQQIDPQDTQTGDLVRTKLGKHVLFVIEKEGNEIYFVDSSREGRGVRYGNFNLTDKDFRHNGFFRLKKAISK